MNASELIPYLENAFEVCQLDSDGKGVRCEHRFADAVRSVYFFRSISSVPKQEELSKLLEEVVAPSFFHSSDAARWSHYLVLVKESGLAASDLEAKLRVESNLDYARKIVLSLEDLPRFVDRSVSSGGGASHANALHATWVEILGRAGLLQVASDEPRRPIVRNIKTGQLSSTWTPPESNESPSAISLPFLSKLELRRFGSRRLAGEFSFSAVNLIRGPNGAGKTSLLEAIEHFLCGATRRSRGVPEVLDASMWFADGKPERNYSPRPTSVYQERDLKWYGRTINKGNKLFEGFARYNFLNADAAVELAGDEDLRDLKGALSKIALGADASHIWNRVHEFIRDIDHEIGPLSKEHDSISVRMAQAKARLAILSENSPQVAAQIGTLESWLREMGWFGGEQVLSLNDTGDFLRFYPLRQLIEAAPVPIPVTEDSAHQEIAAANKHLQTLAEVVEATGRVQQRSLVLKSRSVAIEERTTRARRLSDYVSARFEECLATLQDAGRLREQLKISLVPPGSEVALTEVLSARGWRQLSCVEVRSRLKAEVLDLGADIERQRKERLMLEQVASAQESLLSQIKTLGRRALELNPQLDACPMCVTSMSSTEFYDRMSQPSASNLGEMLERASDSLGDLSVRKLQAENALLAISAHDMGGHSESEAGVFAEALVAARFRLLDAEGAFEKAQTEFARLDLLGFTKTEFESLRQILAMADTEVRSDLLVAEVGSRLDEEMHALRVEQSDIAKAQENLQGQIAILVGHAGFADVADARSNLTARIEVLNRFLEIYDTLPVGVRELFKHDLTGLVDLGRRVWREIEVVGDQIQQERSRSQEVVVLQAAIVRDERELGRVSSERSRLREALQSLVVIRTQHSLDSGLSDFLQENLMAIQSIFSRIHVPNELRLSELADCRLERIGSDATCDLSQISTGQRSALTLSIFLTLNLSLRSGPPVMLIDDPVAHIDDLNALAFVDFLADVAETSRRQIFLATADEKLANLVEKKMQFLGKGFSVVNLASQERSSPLH